MARLASEAVGGPSGRRSAGHPWWIPVRVVLAVACVAWLLAMVQKAPCALDGWGGDDSRYAQMCYSDIPYLYVPRGLAEREVPFSDSAGRYPDLEYPVLIGWFAYGSAVVTQAVHGWPDLTPRREVPADAVHAVDGVDDERQTFFPVTALLLAPFALLTAYFLAGAHRGRPWDAMGYAAAPVLVVTGLINWDLIAVACVAGAFWAWSRDRPLLTGVLLGLGAAAKLYPLFLLGAFLVVALRRGRLPAFGRAATGAAVTWLAVNVPVVVYGFEGWTGFWSFNADRGPDLGSLWLVASRAGHHASVETVNTVSWVVFLGVCVGVLVLGLRAAQPPRIPQLALLVLVGFLVVNKVYSPQYVLWLLPVAVLARPRWRDLMVWQAGELFYFAMVWVHLGSFTAPALPDTPDTAYSWAIVVRVAAELYLAAVVVRDVLRPWRDPVRLTAAAAGGRLDHDPMEPVSRR
ncbi:MAG TPA: glycosyltransferase 87 family protein [Marmoricola sp.]|nr:glycosyltransferase 87 family protein [Marmoricola sp.]